MRAIERIVVKTREQKAVRAIAKGLGIKKERVLPTARFAEDLGAKALDLLNVALALEEEFHVNIPGDQVGRFRTLEDVISFLSEPLLAEEGVGEA